MNSYLTSVEGRPRPEFLCLSGAELRHLPFQSNVGRLVSQVFFCCFHHYCESWAFLFLEWMRKQPCCVLCTTWHNLRSQKTGYEIPLIKKINSILSCIEMERHVTLTAPPTLLKVTTKNSAYFGQGSKSGVQEFVLLEAPL